jgi:hypothetical protein
MLTLAECTELMDWMKKDDIRRDIVDGCLSKSTSGKEQEEFIIFLSDPDRFIFSIVTPIKNLTYFYSMVVDEVKFTLRTAIPWVVDKNDSDFINVIKVKYGATKDSIVVTIGVL